MGKTNKYNDRDHAGLANGTAEPSEHLPRYFAKSGHVDTDPKKTKKNGAGKGGWYAITFQILFLTIHLPMSSPGESRAKRSKIRVSP